mgnify:CR=1 FL=1
MSEEMLVLKRLRKEKYDLSLKIVSLKNFIGTKKWEKLPAIEVFLLDIQLKTMEVYHNILSTRFVLIENRFFNNKEVIK